MKITPHRCMPAAALLMFAAATGAPAQPAASTQPAATQPAPATQPSAEATGSGTVLPGGKVLLNFRNASLDAVLAFLSEAGGLTVINDIKLEGRVNVLNRQPMTIEEAIDVLNTILKDRNYAAVRKGKTLRVVALDMAKKATIPVRTGNDPKDIADTDEVITQVIPVRFADAKQLKTDLAPLIPSYADLSSNVSTNTLILTDTSSNIRRVVEIIRALDTSVSTVSRVKVFSLKYANATSAARLIQEVFKQDTTTTGTQNNNRGGFARFFGGGGGPFGGGGAGGAQASSEEGGKPQNKVTASADDRTNTLVVSAPIDVMPVIEQVLKEIDANPAQDQAVFTYFLRNAQATNIQNVINNLFNTSGTGGRTTTGTTGTNNRNTNTNTNTGRTGNTAGGGGINTGINLGTFGGGAGAGNTNTNRTGMNTTVSAGMPRLSAGASQTAAELAGQVYAVADADTNSVLIMTGSSNFERVKKLLAELDRAVPQVLIKVLLAEVSHNDDKDIGVEFSAINLQGTGKTTAFTDFGVATNTPGGLMLRLIEKDVTASISALQKVGKLDVLSRPYILASDNQTASIIVGQTVPFITNSRTTDTGGTVNTIQYQDIGIILNVTPHINPDGLVIMDVGPEISSISDQTVPISETVNASVFNKRSAQTRIAIADGQTIVIGGLMQDQKTQSTQKVPLLGEIPGLGLLFQRNINKVNKTELLIFLTPHVASDPNRLQTMTEDEKKGPVLVPKAVAPGVYEEHIRGLERGGVHSTTQPATQPAAGGAGEK